MSLGQDLQYQKYSSGGDWYAGQSGDALFRRQAEWEAHAQRARENDGDVAYEPAGGGTEEEFCVDSSYYEDVPHVYHESETVRSDSLELQHPPGMKKPDSIKKQVAAVDSGGAPVAPLHVLRPLAELHDSGVVEDVPVLGLVLGYNNSDSDES